MIENLKEKKKPAAKKKPKTGDEREKEVEKLAKNEGDKISITLQ